VTRDCWWIFVQFIALKKATVETSLAKCEHLTAVIFDDYNRSASFVTRTTRVTKEMYGGKNDSTSPHKQPGSCSCSCFLAIQHTDTCSSCWPSIEHIFLDLTCLRTCSPCVLRRKNGYRLYTNKSVRVRVSPTLAQSFLHAQ
jgi:hypothetical protein